MSEREKIVTYITLQRELRRRERELNKLKKKGIVDNQKEVIIDSIKKSMENGSR